MTHHIEIVIVKDYGRQGLAMFFPNDPANPGRICHSGTLMSYDDEPRGFRPDMENVPLTSGDEADMGYFYSGRKPKDEEKVKKFIERQQRWIQGCLDEGDTVELKRVFKDQQRYRAERWK